MSETPFKLPLREDDSYRGQVCIRDADAFVGEVSTPEQRAYIIAAVNEREALRLENERLREALRELLFVYQSRVAFTGGEQVTVERFVEAQARAALRTPDAKESSRE